MEYVSDIRFLITASVCLEAIAVVASSAEFRGRVLLLGFLIVSLLCYTGFYVPVLLFRNEVIAGETFMKWVRDYDAISTAFDVIAWGLLLAFVVSFRSVPETTGAVAGSQFANGSMPIARALFSFEGRLCRSDYWLKGFLPLLPVGILQLVLRYGVGEVWARALSIVIAILSLWPALALIVKRLHDRDRSGWFTLIFLIPLIGPIVVLVLVWFLKGTDGPNRFGPDPLRPEECIRH